MKIPIEKSKGTGSPEKQYPALHIAPGETPFTAERTNGPSVQGILPEQDVLWIGKRTMTKYRVSYDLLGKNRNYGPLLNELRSSLKFDHVQKSIWEITTNETADQLERRLRRHMRPTDRLSIIVMIQSPKSGPNPDDIDLQ